MIAPTDPVAERVRGAAFRRLLRTSAPASAAQLADELEYTEPAVRTAIDSLAKQGWLRLDADSRVIGSAGLSIHPDRHQIDLDGHRFWTWCAYDILGIFAALRASGHAQSTSPDSDEPVQIRFRDGHPEPAPLVLFRPDDDYAACCTSMYDQWCPNSNLLHTTDAATAWASEHGVTGTALTLPEASERGAQRWRPLTQDP
jgi:alkylmercury lyase